MPGLQSQVATSCRFVADHLVHRKGRGLVSCLVLLLRLSSFSAFFLPVNSAPLEPWSHPPPYNGTPHYLLSPSGPVRTFPPEWNNTATGESIVFDYPWTREHDSRPNRENHLDWRFWAGEWSHYAGCWHWLPGAYAPMTKQKEYLGEWCDSLLHNDLTKEPWAKMNWKEPIECPAYPNGSTIEGRRPEYTFRLHTWRGWKSYEHCRAGCETCFDAMYEYGVESALCIRRISPAQFEWSMPTCHLEVMKVDSDMNRHGKIKSKAESGQPGAYMYYEDDTNGVKGYDFLK